MVSKHKVVLNIRTLPAAHADQNSCIQDKLPNMFGVLCCESGGANVCGLTLRHHSVSQHHLTFNKSAVE